MEYEKGNKWINFLFRAISDLCQRLLHIIKNYTNRMKLKIKMKATNNKHNFTQKAKFNDGHHCVTKQKVEK